MLAFRFSLFRSLSHQSRQPHHLIKSNKRIRELVNLGRFKEARQLFDKMPQRDSFTWTSIISACFHCGHIHELKSIFDACDSKNVHTWTALLTGYAKHGLLDEARAVFDSMPERNVVSWNAMVSGYVQNGDLRKGRDLFDLMPERNVGSWNSVITGYCRGGFMREARGLFDRMPERSSVSWLVMISGYVDCFDYLEAWGLFLMMLGCGGRVEQGTLVVAYSAVTGLNSSRLVENLRTLVVKTGYEGDVVVGNSIVNAYTRTGSLEDGFKFFKAMSEKSEYTWTTMIAAFSQCDRLDEAIKLYECVPEKSVSVRSTMMSAYAQKGKMNDARNVFDGIASPDVVTWNAMVAGYAQNGMIQEASDMLLQMPVRNVASWAAMISGLVQNAQSREALNLFSELHKSGTFPSHSCLTSALSACGYAVDIEMGRQIHSLAIKMRFQYNLYVGNRLIFMYAKCKNTGDLSRVFNTMKARDAVSWNSLITGFLENFMLEDARHEFEKIPERDALSWTTMALGYIEAGKEDIAWGLFRDMLRVGVMPNSSTFAVTLSACGILGAYKLGENIQALVFKLGFNSCLEVCNALISMYFKCGNLDALHIFEEMPVRDVITWNAVLTGCSQNGLANEAIQLFDQMLAAGIWPDDISFLGFLSACAQFGLVDKGWAYFKSMSQDYGIEPSIHHYTCMINILGRAGMLSEAESLIESMPKKPDNILWNALLVACRVHHNVEVGQRVGERLLQMGIFRSGIYDLLSSIYAYHGMWDAFKEMKELMKDMRASEEPEISWIQIKSQLHCFQLGDQARNDIEEILFSLKDYSKHSKSTYFAMDTKTLNQDVEKLKSLELPNNDEKLALAYGV